MIDTPGRSGYLKSGEHTTHYLEWGDASSAQVLLLLHGFRGHAHWWDFIAPWFAADYRVIAPDFSGMGDSSPRLNYQRSDFVAEVQAMLKMIGPKAVTLVGHSFGGRIAVFAAHEYPQLLQRAIVIDTNIGFADQPLRTRFVQRPKKIYPDFKTACARFRFVPDEPPILPRIMQHLAAHSIKQQGGGYTWKFDENPIGSGWEHVAEGELLGDIVLPTDFIAGEFSEVVPPALANRIGKALRHGRGPIVIPSAYHHVPVDQPLALVAVLRALLL
ncbi:MAG TPA: alpha/beta hydrolase [Steroidobacteraceae bacterium]|nr:alpha/beta hydrolase [Steroidobacteraceae bacterium]